MSLEVSSDPEVARLDVGAYLLASAIIGHFDQAETLFFNEQVTIVFEKRSERIPLSEISPWPWADYKALCTLFPFSGASQAIRRGLYGSSIRQNFHGESCIGMYATRDGAEFFWSRISNFAPAAQFPIDIVQTEGIRFAQAASSRGATSISPNGGQVTGTLGAWLKDRSSGEFIGISNNHVLTEFNRFPAKTEVIHPGIADGGRSGNVIAEVEGLVPLKEDDPQRPHATINSADVAWCKPKPSVIVNQTIGSGSILPRGEVDLVRAWYNNRRRPIPVYAVVKPGLELKGSMKALLPLVFMSNPHDPTKSYAFRSQLELELPGVQDGHSGSLVFSAAGHRDRIGALLFAIGGGPDTAIVTPWKVVRAQSRLAFQY